MQHNTLYKILRTSAVALSFVVAVLTIASAYGGTVNPLTTPIGAILAMTFPIFLVLSLILGVVNLLWMPRLAIVNALAIVLCWSPILTFCPLNFLRPAQKEIASIKCRTFKIMTFNVFTFNDITGSDDRLDNGNSTIAYILREDPDIVIAQESGDILKANYKHISGEQHREILNNYPHRHVDNNGMCILSKFPIEPYKSKANAVEGLDSHRYEVYIDGTKLHILNVHMQSIGLTSADKEMYVSITEGDTPDQLSDLRHGILHKLAAAFRRRAHQAIAIREELDNLDGNVLLCGDFNDIPGSYASRVVAGSDMTDAYRHAGLGPAITYHADKLYFRIDQMFYRGNLDALRAWVGKCPSSDHYPLVAIFALNK